MSSEQLGGESYRAHQQCEDGQEGVGQGDERHDSVVGGEVHWGAQECHEVLEHDAAHIGGNCGDQQGDCGASNLRTQSMP